MNRDLAIGIIVLLSVAIIVACALLWTAEFIVRSGSVQP